MSSRTKRSRAADTANDQAKSKKFKSAKESNMTETVVQPSRQNNEADEPYWEISAKRRVTVREYKNMTLVDLREFYEKDGKFLPGKSGISLTVDQFTALLLALPDIKQVLAEKGIVVADAAEDKDEIVDDTKVEANRESEEDTDEED